MLIGLVLQRAVTRLITDRAVQGMVDEQELKRVFLRPFDQLAAAVGFDHHSVRHLHRTARLQFRHELDDGIAVFVRIDLARCAVTLRHTDLYEALTTVCRSRHGRVIAEMGQIDAVVQTELEEALLPLEFKGLVVNGDSRHIVQSRSLNRTQCLVQAVAKSTPDATSDGLHLASNSSRKRSMV